MAFFGDNLFNKKKVIDVKKEEMKNNTQLWKENQILSQHLAQTGSWTHDLVQGKIYFSDEIYQILGVNPQDFDGSEKNYYLFVHPEDLEVVRAAIHGSVEGKEYDLEYRILAGGESLRFVREKTTVLYAKNKRPIRIIGVLQDVTKEKLLEKKLITLGENLNQAQKIARLGSWNYNTIKGELFWSDEIYRMYGLDAIKHQPDFNHLLELSHPDDRDGMKNAVHISLSGKKCEFEYRIPQGNGLNKTIHAKMEPILGKNQKITGLVGTIQDITEIKEM